jgi:hypothetical protein
LAVGGLASGVARIWRTKTVLAMVALRKSGLVFEEFGLREDTLEHMFFNFSYCLGWKVGKS